MIEDSECEDHNVKFSKQTVSVALTVKSGEAHVLRDELPVEVQVVHCADCDAEPQAIATEEISLSDVKSSLKKGDMMLEDGVIPENHPHFDA